MQLIDNAKAVWKHYSTWALTTVAGVGGTWVAIPEEIKSNLPHWVAQGVSWTVFFAGLFGLAGKFSPQKSLTDDKPKDAP